jgi:hypothetical protein
VLTPIEIEIIGGSIGIEGITSFLPISLMVCVTIAFVKPAICTISPATALAISNYCIPYLLKIFSILAVSTNLPYWSTANTLSFTLTSP